MCTLPALHQVLQLRRTLATYMFVTLVELQLHVRSFPFVDQSEVDIGQSEEESCH